MKLYLDAISGISGDMLVAALLATGKVSFEEFEKELGKLNIMRGYRLDYQQVTKGSIGGYAFKVTKDQALLKEDVEVDDEQERSEEIDKTRYKTGHGRWKNSYGNMESRSHFKHKNRTRYDVQVELEDKREEKNRSHRFRFGRRYRNELMEKEEIEKNGLIAEQETEHGTGHKTLQLQEEAIKVDPVKNLVMAKQWIEESELEEEIKKKTIEIFDLIADAKSEGSDILKEEIRFDEVIQVVASVILISKMGVQEIYVSVADEDSEESHLEDISCGKDSSSNLESSSDMKIDSLSAVKELGTSVGLAILTIYRAIFEQPLNMKIKAVGVGCGEKEIDVPNMLKAVLFEEIEPICPETAIEPSEADYEENNEKFESEELRMETIIEVQCAMEDMTGEEIEYAIEKVNLCSLDVCLSSVLMKSLKPGYHLRVMCLEEELSQVIRIILSHTTAVGIYTNEVKRYFLLPETETIETEIGKARLKTDTLSGNILRKKWDYQDLVRLAEENNMNLREVRRTLWRETLKK